MWTGPRTDPFPFPFELLAPFGEFVPFPCEPISFGEFDPFPCEPFPLVECAPFPFALCDPLPAAPFPFELFDFFSFNCDFEPRDPDLLTSFFFCFLEDLELLEPFPLLDLALVPEPFPLLNLALVPEPFPLLDLALVPDPFPFELFDAFPFPFELFDAPFPFEAFELLGTGYDSVAPGCPGLC